MIYRYPSHLEEYLKNHSTVEYTTTSKSDTLLLTFRESLFEYICKQITESTLKVRSKANFSHLNENKSLFQAMLCL